MLMTKQEITEKLKDILLVADSGNADKIKAADENTRLTVKPTAQVLTFIVEHCRAFLKCPPCVIDTHFFYSRVGIVPHSFISIQNSCHVA